MLNYKKTALLLIIIYFLKFISPFSQSSDSLSQAKSFINWTKQYGNAKNSEQAKEKFDQLRLKEITDLSLEIHIEDNIIPMIDFSLLSNLKSLKLVGNKVRLGFFKTLTSVPELVSLTLQGPTGQSHMSSEIMQIVSSLTNLKELRTTLIEFKDPDIVRFSALENLTTLTINSAKLSDRQLNFLPFLTGLKFLNLQRNEIVNCAHFPQLIKLEKAELGDNQINDAGAMILGTLTSLTTLSLQQNKIKAHEILNLQTLTNLALLNLSMNEIGSIGVQRLHVCTNLTNLILGQTSLGDQGLLNFPVFANLTNLHLQNNRITPISLHILRPYIQLVYLDLSLNPIGNKGLEIFSNLRNLQTLRVHTCNISNVDALVSLSQLSILELSENALTDSNSIHAIQALLNLKILNLQKNPITQNNTPESLGLQWIREVYF